MGPRIGMGSAYYGQADPRHLESVQRARELGVPGTWLVGSAYPEISRAELVRQALMAEAEAIVIVDSNLSFEAKDVVELGESAIGIGGVVNGLIQQNGRTIPPHADPWDPTFLPDAAFTAISLEAIRKLAARESREYTNTAIIETAVSKDARPFFSPWNKAPGTLDTPPIEEGVYCDPDRAFMLRAREAGIRIEHLSTSAKRLSGGNSEIRIRPGDAKKRATEKIPNFPVCIPRFGGTDIEQHELVRKLNEGAGVTVIECQDCPHVDLARSALVMTALDECGADGVFFLDHDIIFQPNDALSLMCEAHLRQDVVAAVYNMRKTAHALIGAIDVPQDTEVGFFGDGMIYPALYAGMGFCAVPRAVFRALDERLPLLRSYYGDVRPYFALDTNGNFYSGEDVSFCARVQGLTVKTVPGSGNENGFDWELSRDSRGTNHRVFLDTRIRIFHKGAYHYGVEDHSIAVPRYGYMKAKLCATREEARKFNLRADELSGVAKNRSQGLDTGATVPHGTLPESLSGE